MHYWYWVFKLNYKLITLESSYPGFTGQKRVENISGDYWEDLKRAYNYRCATCGSKEGEPNYNWPETITKLQKGHMDPSKPLEEGNVITVEPGLYFADLGIGVRIEDDVLIHQDKAEVLSINIPKEIADIEKLFRTKGL